VLLTAFGHLDIAVIGPALLAGMLVLASAAPLGLIIARRRGPFTCLALAQTAALGVTAGQAFWGAPNVLAVQVSALVAALACGALLTGLQRRSRAPDVAAALMFAMAAALQLALLSRAPDGTAQLRNMLAGWDVTLSPKLLVGTVLLAFAALMIWWLQDTIRTPLVLNLVLAVVAGVAVQIVGLLLVLVSVTLPAAAVRRAPGSWQPLMAFNVGALGYAVGLVASAMLAIPAGPAIVCVMIPLGLAADQAIGLIFGRGIRPPI
jgi:zinc/manganese transport system permease protein